MITTNVSFKLTLPRSDFRHLADEGDCQRSIQLFETLTKIPVTSVAASSSLFAGGNINIEIDHREKNRIHRHQSHGRSPDMRKLRSPTRARNVESKFAELPWVELPSIRSCQSPETPPTTSGVGKLAGSSRINKAGTAPEPLPAVGVTLMVNGADLASRRLQRDWIDDLAAIMPQIGRRAFKMLLQVEVLVFVDNTAPPPAAAPIDDALQTFTFFLIPAKMDRDPLPPGRACIEISHIVSNCPAYDSVAVSTSDKIDSCRESRTYSSTVAWNSIMHKLMKCAAVNNVFDNKSNCPRIELSPSPPPSMIDQSKNNGVPAHQDPFKLQDLEQLRQEHNDLRKLHQAYVTSSTKSIDDLTRQLQTEKNNLTASTTKLTQEAAVLMADRDAKMEKLNNLEDMISELKKDVCDEKQKSSDLAKSLNELSSSIQKLHQELDTVNSQLDREKQLSQEQQDELQQQEKAIAELKEKLELAMKELEVEKRRPRIPRIKKGILTLDQQNIIDAGSTATVYSTTYLGAPVAAKLYHPKIVGGTTIQRELKAAAHLKHPNIVSVISMIEENKSDQVHGVLLELMGDDLSRHLKSNPQVSLRQRLQWLLEASQGIFCSHSLGVIHSDIKPENILLSTANPPIAKLADFGCAKLLSTAAPSTMGVRGTASFISPEYLNQITGATKQSDIFSLGMTIWTVLHTDVKDSSLGQTAEQMNQSVKGNVRPQIASDVPLEIKTLIEKCWNQDPAQRPNIEEVIQVLTQSVQQLEGQNEFTFELSPLWTSDKYLKNKHPNIGTLLNALRWSPGQDAKTLLFSNDIVDPLHPLFQFVASKFRPTAAVQKRSQYKFPGYQFDRKISRIQFVHPKSNVFLQLHDEDNQSRAANSYLNLQPTFFVAQQEKLVLEKLHSLFEDPEISSGNPNQSRVLFAWHGTGAENAEKVCRDGPRGFRDTDAGFFCAGSYFAAEFDYCTKYSTLSGSNSNGEFSVILYALSVSQAYPVTLEKDYRKIEDAATPQLHGFSNFYSGDSNKSIALMPRCDCHFIPTKKYYKKHPLGFFQVKERDGTLSKMTSDVAVQLDEQACNELDDEMTGHEIVLHSHTRALPIAIVYFQ